MGSDPTGALSREGQLWLWLFSSSGYLNSGSTDLLLSPVTAAALGAWGRTLNYTTAQLLKFNGQKDI